MRRMPRRLSTWTFLVLGFLCQLAPSLHLMAQADPGPAAPSVAPAKPPVPDAEGFVPESRPANMPSVDEAIPAAPLVATAYGFIWVAVLGFVLFTWQRTQKLEQEITDLKARIDNARPSERPLT